MYTLHEERGVMHMKEKVYDGTPSAAIASKEPLSQEDMDALAQAGVAVNRADRSGTFLLRDQSPFHVLSPNQDYELLPIADALDRYAWLKKRYVWKAVPENLDEITQKCAAQKPVGYFLHVHKGAKVELPCQTALYLAEEGLSQSIHNVVILEEDSELRLITGCVSGRHVSAGRHLSIDEQYVGKNAKLVNNMIHAWEAGIEVYPRSGTIVEAGGRYESAYIALKPPKCIESVPVTWLNGDQASAKLLSIVLANAGSTIEIGGDVHLNADDVSAELIHRGVSAGGEILQKGLLTGNGRCKAHVDCAGMLLDPAKQGAIESVPGIKVLDPDARLSHEASIGKIAPDQIEYLQSRGLDENEATSLLIRGFLGANLEGFGPEIDEQIAKIAELAGHGEH